MTTDLLRSKEDGISDIKAYATGLTVMLLMRDEARRRPPTAHDNDTFGPAASGIPIPPMDRNITNMELRPYKYSVRRPIKGRRTH